MIDYILVPNTLGENPTGFHAITVQTENRTTEDFIRLMAELKGGATEGEAAQWFDVIQRAMVEELQRGGNFNLKGFAHGKVDVLGTFANPDSNIDHVNNKLRATISFSSAFQKKIDGSATRRVPAENSGMFIEHVHDVASNTNDDKLTPGMGLQVFGGKIKVAGPGATNGVAFLDADGDPIDVPPAAIIHNGDKLIELVTPNLLAGTYHLQITTQYSTSGTLLQEPRTYIFPHALTVGSGS
jgi:hypothetical protein